MSGKIFSVAFQESIQIGNDVKSTLVAGQPVDGREVRLDLITDTRGLLVHWEDHKGKKFANLVPWQAIRSIVLDMEPAVETYRGPGRPRLDASK